MRLLRCFALLLVIALSACDFQKEADGKFGDQHFKTAIALIELHKIRSGSYPSTLNDIQFTGAWDAMALAAVQYRRLDSGYELNINRGWVAQPELTYPKPFWQGLGLVRSNAKVTP